jgi:hypothetical protein
MPSQHKHPPISLRLPGADRAWLLEYAAAQERPVNGVLAEAVALLRHQVEGGTTARHAHTAPARAARHQREDDCPHPKARIHKGLCGACGTNVGGR